MKKPVVARTFLLAALSFCLLSVPGTTVAQADLGRPNVPPEFLDFTRRLQGDSLVVCVNSESILAPFEIDLARAIGDALLVAVEINQVVGYHAPPILDYRFPVNEEELFVLLYNDCQMMTGFLLSESRFADWLTISTPYLEMGFVIATGVANPASALADLAPGSRIGTKVISAADLAFTNINLNLAEALRWRRIPYPDNQMLIEKLHGGEVDAILVWEAGLMAGTNNDLDSAGFQVIASHPLVLPTQRFGAVLLDRDAFLRHAVDEAIRALAQDGTIDQLLRLHGLPGAAPR